MSGHESPAAGTFGCGVCWPASAPDAYEASRQLEFTPLHPMLRTLQEAIEVLRARLER